MLDKNKQLQNRIINKVLKVESILKSWNKSQGEKCQLIKCSPFVIFNDSVNIQFHFIVYKQYFCFPII